jgi:hypothetical protein
MARCFFCYLSTTPCGALRGDEDELLKMLHSPWLDYLAFLQQEGLPGLGSLLGGVTLDCLTDMSSSGVQSVLQAAT